MDNSKRNVHNSGPLGMLVKTGQIKKIDLSKELELSNESKIGLHDKQTPTNLFKTSSGIKFNENELIFADPNECEPWEYANRSSTEMGNIDELVASIKENGQLQPALIRTHPKPHGKIKYQIIFGRRRHAASLILKSKFLVIRKDSLSLQEAVACQDAENKFRKDVSNYSNAMLYQRLLNTKAFKTKKELAEKLRMSPASLSELMAYTKLPQELVEKISDIHKLPIYMATKIVNLLSESNNILEQLILIAPEIGKSITTPAKLESALLPPKKGNQIVPHRTVTVMGEDGKNVLTFKVNHKGVPSISFRKELLDQLDFDDLCLQIKLYIDRGLKFGRPKN